MIKADGSYPTSFDSMHGRWEYVMPLNPTIAKTILLTIAQGDDVAPHPDGAGYLLTNKCFRVFQQGQGEDAKTLLWGVYNHDGQHWVISCPIEEAKNLRCWNPVVGSTTDIHPW